MGNCRSKKEYSSGENKEINEFISNGDNEDNNRKQTKLIGAQYSGKLQSAPSRAGNNCNLQQTTPSSNKDVIYSTRVEVNYLLLRINEFEGTSESDKNYRYLDEMLTRCMLNLDEIKCNNIEDRTERKEVISGVNQAIAILERKLAINSDIKELASNLEND